MATWDDVRRIALALPETDEIDRRGDLAWRVRTKAFGAKEALRTDDPDVYFTTPHFNGFPAVLVRLERMEPPDLEELLVEAWLDRAPKRLAAEYLKS